MKKTIFMLMAALVALSPIANAQLKIKGSDTCLPLSQKEAEAYKAGKVSVTGGGSGVGISSLIAKTCDIAMASRSMKLSEKKKMQSSGRQVKEVIIAYDAIAVVVNPNNKVNQLTRQQLEDIYTGKITNWNQVGGENMKIVVYTRESSSGTNAFFKEHVMKNKNYMASCLAMPATGAIIQSVKQTKGAIGYVGLAYVNSSVKALAVSYTGKNFVKPSVQTAKNKTYPIVRPLLYYYAANNTKRVKPFIDFVLSAQGQKIVSEVGYIPVK